MSRRTLVKTETDVSRDTPSVNDSNDVTKTPKNLSFYHQLDPWQQDNHFIRSGYVKETRDYAGCLRSLLYVHNETVNIYSHLIPAITGGLAILQYVAGVSVGNYPAWVTFAFEIFGCGLFTCLFLSALFHLLKSHSHLVCKFGNQCDYFGIVAMITCSLISIILFTFHETPIWRNSFIVLFLFVGSLCAFVTFDAKFSTPDYRPFRSMMFIVFGLCGAFPVAGAVYLFGVSAAFSRSGAYYVILEGVIYIFGASLYAMRVPERWVYDDDDLKFKVGIFDLYGHLHQIFHFMVVIAAFCHWTALTEAYADWKLRSLR